MSVRCYVLAFPVWSREIGDRVEAFRAAHDPPGIAAHFTLVFGVTQAAAIGRAGSGQGAQAMCDRWNEHGQQLIGHIDTLTVGTLADGHFCIHSTHPLRAP